MDIKEKESTISRYRNRYKKFGYSPAALGWLKGKQELRFDILTSLYDFNDKSVLDIGCGFGDLVVTLRRKADVFKYLGCDLCFDLVDEGKKRYPGAQFVVGDFLETEFNDKIDWAIASGPFNYKFQHMDNYSFIKSVMVKAHGLVTDGFSFDFISNKVDYKDDHIFYSAPDKVLSMAYELSRNVVLRSDYMPFEFSIFVFKDDSFDKSDTIFNKYKNENF